MAKEDYGQLAKEVVAAVGGKENIVSVSNCMTRLRFVLKDDTIPNKDEVSKIKGVKGVMNQGGQYQVIIGTHVSEVVKFVKTEAGITGNSKAVNKEDYQVMKKDSLWNRFFKVISGCIMPMIGPMIAGGILKGILVILTTMGILTNTDGTYLVLYAASDAIMYFMPIIVGFSCGKIFDCNPYTTAAIGAALVYPNLVAAIAAEGGITFLHIPVSTTTYANTLFPIILASFFASKVEKLAKKVLPEMIQLMMVPTVVLALTVPLSYLVIGPVMQYVSNGLSTVVCGIFNFSPILGGLLFGAFWQLVVLLGLHAAFIPVLMNNLFTLGSDPINAILGLTVWALAGVALGYSLRTKDPDKRSAGFGSLASALCGVTEPAIYSIAVPNMKLFACAWVGGGISGAILGGLGAKLYALAGDGLFRIPGMINPAGLDVSFYGFIACAVLAFGVSAVLAYIVQGKEEKEPLHGATAPFQHAYLPKQVQHTGLRAGTHGLTHQLALLEHQQGGDAHHPELRRQVRLLVHVHLAHLYIGALLGYLVHHRAQHPAGAAPAGPEVQQNGLFAVEHFLCKVFLGNVDDCHIFSLLNGCCVLLTISVYPIRRPLFRDRVTQAQKKYRRAKGTAV